MTVTQLALTIAICYIMVSLAWKGISGKFEGSSADDYEEINEPADWEPQAGDYTLRRSMRNFRPKLPEKEYKWYSFRIMRQRTYDKMKSELEWLTEEVNLTESQLCKKYADEWATIYAEAVQGRERAEAEKMKLQRVVEDQNELIGRLYGRIRSQEEKMNVVRDEASGLYKTSNPLKAETSREGFAVVQKATEEPEPVADETEADATTALMNYLEISTQTELKQAVAYWMLRSGKDETAIAEKIGCKSTRQYIAKGKKIIESKVVSMQRESDPVIKCMSLSELDTDTLMSGEYEVCADSDFEAISLLSQLSA